MEFNFSERMDGLAGNAIREIFKLLQDPDVISFAGGFPSKDLMPNEMVRDIAVDLMNGPDAREILQYGGTEGYMPFRKTAVDYVQRYGIGGIGIENTLIISGGQQGIDLLCKSFLNKGDVVLVENPTYLAVLHILKTYQAKAVGVDSGDDGLDIADLEAKIIKYKPKFLYCVPTFSNPTGRTYSVENRKAIAELTSKYGVVVLEDDPYSELRFSGDRVPSLKSFEKDDNVIYITSFSKTFAPGLRTGIAVGNKEIIRKMTICKQAVDVHTSSLSQAIVNEFIRRGYLDNRLETLVPIYREKRDLMLSALDKYMPGGFEHTNPNGGLFIFGAFDKSLNIDTNALFSKVAKEKVAYVSGHSFYADENVFNTIRLNFSMPTKEQIVTGVERLGEFFKREIREGGGR